MTPLRRFSTSNGCQDHTTSPSAKASFVSRAIRQLTGLNRPALPSPGIARRCRVHRIPPRVRDDRDTPLEWDETAALMDLIWVRREGIYFCKQEWTGQIRLIHLNKSVFCENCLGAILVRLRL